MRHAAEMIRRALYADLLAVDLLLSALTFGAPMQTISARLAKGRIQGNRVAAIFANGVDAIVAAIFHQHDHCEVALAAFVARESASSSWSG